jgi:hypothetical protein
MNTPSPERLCPNCRQSYDGEPQFCPHCGFNLQPIPQPKFVAGSAAVDSILAVLLSLICAPMLVTMLVPLILYFGMDNRYVDFRTSLRVMLIIFAVLALGALALCTYFTITASSNINSVGH